MIWTVFQISARRLIHSRSEILLTFGVPIVFFSIFALIFSSGVGCAKTPKINVIVVDELGVEGCFVANVSFVHYVDTGSACCRRNLVAQLDRRDTVRGSNDSTYTACTSAKSAFFW